MSVKINVLSSWADGGWAEVLITTNTPVTFVFQTSVKITSVTGATLTNGVYSPDSWTKTSFGYRVQFGYSGGSWSGTVKLNPTSGTSDPIPVVPQPSDPVPVVPQPSIPNTNKITLTLRQFKNLYSSVV